MPLIFADWSCRYPSPFHGYPSTVRAGRFGFRVQSQSNQIVMLTCSRRSLAACIAKGSPSYCGCGAGPQLGGGGSRLKVSARRIASITEHFSRLNDLIVRCFQSAFGQANTSLSHLVNARCSDLVKLESCWEQVYHSQMFYHVFISAELVAHQSGNSRHNSHPSITGAQKRVFNIHRL